MSVVVKIIAVKIIVLAMASGFPNDQRSRVGNGLWQCSSPERIDNVRARSKVGNVPVAMFL